MNQTFPPFISFSRLLIALRTKSWLLNGLQSPWHPGMGHPPAWAVEFSLAVPSCSPLATLAFFQLLCQSLCTHRLKRYLPPLQTSDRFCWTATGVINATDLKIGRVAFVIQVGAISSCEPLIAENFLELEAGGMQYKAEMTSVC